MKFFKNNKAITLIELITSIAISSILFFIIFIFITDSVEELVDNNVKIASIDEWFSFKDTMWRFVRWGFTDATILTWATDAWYTWKTNPNPNSVLYLKKFDWSEWIIVWIVDINTKKLQKHYTYWNNFLWYKFVSTTVMNDLDSNPTSIYDQIFPNDKIFQWLRMKDFIVQNYNWWNAIDIYFSVINLYDNTHFEMDFNEFFIDKLVIEEYNLVF